VRLTIRTADQATVRLFDGLVVFWLVLWLVVGTWSGITIWQLSDLGDTVSTSGRALTSAGRALESVGNVPVIGEGPAQLGREVVATADDITGRGAEIKSQLRQLSLLLGLSIMLMPTTPVLGLYLPLRAGRRREVAEIRRLVRTHGRDATVERYLAERALETMPFAAVLAICPDPYTDIAQHRAGALADAELRRLGVRGSVTG